LTGPPWPHANWRGMTNDQIKDQMRQFIMTNFVFDKRRVLKDEESLLESGVVDSTGILEVIAYLEEHFAVKVEDIEFRAENFDSIERITTFVAKKLSAGVH
jgi:acyl carrier protein